ncbi:hypothetical protein ASF61_07390 [Duganella sp. Leaf126]|nr:hypothetical protein ASF61_07390 [Duganella sp. Leaf126]
MILSLLVLAGCNKPGDAPQAGATAAAQPQPAPYTPPTAEQLSQMVAPIALFPDKLVGQVLAGATYPEQITAANQWLAQNPTLKGDALQNAEAGQPWDVSVKSLTTFPSVLGQMASNIQWTTALGEAYVNDPNDVMNAIQLLRARAQQSGNLKTSQHLRVATVSRTTESAYPATAPASNSSSTYIERSSPDPVVYSGPPVIPPPQQTIIIEPAQPDVVYVPHYNPTVVYGAPVPVYPGWVETRPSYSTETLVETGALSFGIGVLVGAAVSHHHDWGWNAWGVNWGGPAPYGGYNGYNSYNGGWHRPAVVYNNTTYVSKSVTVVNRVNNITNNNFNNSVNTNNYRTNVATTNNVNNRTQNFAGNNGGMRPGAVMGASRLAANPPNFGPSFGTHAGPAAAASFAPNGAQHGSPFGAGRNALMAANPAQPHQNAMMTMPHFSQRDTVAGARPLPAAAAQSLHAGAAPQMNQFASHTMPAMPQHAMPSAQPGQQAQRWQPAQQGQQAWRDARQSPPSPPAQQAQHIQPAQQQAPHMLQAARIAPPQAAGMAAPQAARPVHDERGAERMQAQAQMQAQMERQHADAMARERHAASVPMQPAPRMEQAMHSAPAPHRDAAPDRGQPQFNRQEMVAMHAAPPHQAEPHQAAQMERHDAPHRENHENHESHQNRDRHDGRERHG